MQGVGISSGFKKKVCVVIVIVIITVVIGSDDEVELQMRVAWYIFKHTGNKKKICVYLERFTEWTFLIKIFFAADSDISIVLGRLKSLSTFPATKGKLKILRKAESANNTLS